MSGEITELLDRWGNGDPEAFHHLVPLVYEELHRVAAAHLRDEHAAPTLRPTGIVHEAYLRMVNRPTGNWKSRAQFFAMASQVMRRVLVDHARARLRLKRGGGTPVRVTLDDGIDWPLERSVQLSALDDALDALARMDQRQSRIVELRFFTGLSIDETAEVLALSPATVKRDWTSARAWLLRELRQTPSDGNTPAAR